MTEIEEDQLRQIRDLIGLYLVIPRDMIETTDGAIGDRTWEYYKPTILGTAKDYLWKNHKVDVRRRDGRSWEAVREAADGQWREVAIRDNEVECILAFLLSVQESKNREKASGIKTSHDANCTYYWSDKKIPAAGICTCGYGIQRARATDDWGQVYALGRGSWETVAKGTNR